VLSKAILLEIFENTSCLTQTKGTEWYGKEGSWKHENNFKKKLKFFPIK
jgi:hypothetical protein